MNKKKARKKKEQKGTKKELTWKEGIPFNSF